ncbi:MAG: glycosyltransferase family 4 protein [Nitrospiraceae bacterium]
MLVTNSVTHDPRVRKEAALLTKKGYEVTIIGARDENSPYTEELDGCRIIRVLTLRHVYGRFVPPRKSNHPMVEGQSSISFLTKLRADVLNIVSVIWLNMMLATSAASQKADIYHAHDLDTLLSGFLAKSWMRAKLIYDFHELFTEQFRDGIKTKLWKTFYCLLERFLVKRADLRVTVCRSLGEWATKHYGINGVLTIRNVPPLQTWVSVHCDRNRDRIILYHGGYYRDRGLEQLVESARFLKSGHIVFRGYGNLEDHLRGLVKQLGVKDRVRFSPPVPMGDLVRAASEADIGVIPYIPFCLNNRFCLPNKLFEYMMAGLAVVGSDLPELRNIIVGQKIGAVFNPQDPRDIARVFNEVLLDHDRLETMRQNARQAARDRYNWELEGETLLRAYESLAEA